MTRPRLGEILGEQAGLTDEQLDKAVAESRAKPSRIGEALLAQRLITEEQLAAALAEQFGLPLCSGIPEGLCTSIDSPLLVTTL